MKFRDARITANDDGTYQVEVCGGNDSGPMEVGNYSRKTYSAKDLAEAIAKIEEGKTEIESAKEKSRKQRGKPDKSVTDFVGASDSDD